MNLSHKRTPLLQSKRPVIQSGKDRGRRETEKRGPEKGSEMQILGRGPERGNLIPETLAGTPAGMQVAAQFWSKRRTRKGAKFYPAPTDKARRRARGKQSSGDSFGREWMAVQAQRAHREKKPSGLNRKTVNPKGRET